MAVPLPVEPSITASNTVQENNTGPQGNTGITGNTATPPSAQGYAKLQAEFFKLQAQLQSQAANSQVPPSATSALTMHWNNKGNPVESLTPRMVDSGHYGLIWYTGNICWHATYCDSGSWSPRRV